MLYHAEFVILGRDWFGGGFFGVDIFFVISGYLISRIIFSELHESGSFNFLNFYERRARRILPMLFTVMFLSFPFAWRLLLTADFEEYCNSIISAVFFGSNFFFYFTTTEYGADSALLKPFLHTWSLGIEEQFYIVFPILLLAFHKFLRKHVLAICIALGLLSFVFAVYIGARNTELNFYLPMSRAWELLAGAVLAYTEVRHGRRQLSKTNQIFAAVGLCFIVFPVFLFGVDGPHPGVVTLMPVIGVALVIAFSTSDDVVGKLLGSKPLVGIGLVSYSAYLWHYPIFAFSRISDSAPSVYDKLIWIFLTLALSSASYFWIEQPFRDRSFLRKKILTLGLSSVVIIVGGLQLASSYSSRIEGRMPAILTHEDFSQRPWTSLQQDGRICFDTRCVFLNDNSSTWIQLLGDSHMASLQFDLANRLKNRANVVSWTRGGCWPVLGVNRYNENGAIKGGCGAAFQQQRFDDITEVENSIVVLSGRLPLYLSRYGFDNQEGGVETFSGKNTFHAEFRTTDEAQKLKDAVVDSLMTLLNQGHKVVLVYPIPEVGWDVPRKIISDMPSSVDKVASWLTNNPITTSYDVYLERSKESIEIFDSIEHENLFKVYPHKLFCDNQIKGRCVTHDNEHLFYADESHPSYKGAEMINSLILREIDTISLTAEK